MDIQPLIALAELCRDPDIGRLIGHDVSDVGRPQEWRENRRADKKLIEHDRRIQTVENEMRHLPNKDTVKQTPIDMTDLKGRSH